MDAKQQAIEIARKQKRNFIYSNTKGEWFTEENLAILSENGKKDNVKSEPVPAAGEKKESSSSSAKNDKKPLEKMNKAELQAEYLAVSGQSEVPAELSTNPKLLEAIKELQKIKGGGEGDEI